MTKQEQIEEISKFICKHNYQGVCLLDQTTCDGRCNWLKAEAIYNAGYRKIYDNCEVITKDDLKLYKKQAVKEFAEKLKERLNLGLYEWQYAKVNSKVIDELLKEYTDTKINDRFMWSTDGKVWERDLTHCAFDGEAIDRLAELEDKIESGHLVEFPFAVIDKRTKREADEYKISIKEDWAKDLCYCDMDGFAITQDGNLILLDECGKYTSCPCDRFEVIAEARLKELQEGKK